MAWCANGAVLAWRCVRNFLQFLSPLEEVVDVEGVDKGLLRLVLDSVEASAAVHTEEISVLYWRGWTAAAFTAAPQAAIAAIDLRIPIVELICSETF